MSCNKEQYDNRDLARQGADPAIMEHMKSLRSGYSYESVGNPADDQTLDNSKFADLHNAYSYTPTMAEFKNRLMQKTIFKNPNDVPFADSEGTFAKQRVPLSETAEINKGLSNLLSRHVTSKADQVDDIIDSMYAQPQRDNMMMRQDRPAYQQRMPMIEKNKTSLCELLMWIFLLLIVICIICWMFNSYHHDSVDYIQTDTHNFVVTLPE